MEVTPCVCPGIHCLVLVGELGNVSTISRRRALSSGFEVDWASPDALRSIPTVIDGGKWRHRPLPRRSGKIPRRGNWFHYNLSHKVVEEREVPRSATLLRQVAEEATVL